MREKKKGVPPIISEYFAELGRRAAGKGGKARAAKMTPEERSESARKAVRARWAKRDKAAQVEENPSQEGKDAT